MGEEKEKKWGLVLTVTGGGSRVFKYKHNASIVFDLDDRQEAILCLLFLRGALTPGEINSNSGRLYSFGSLESVLIGLESLASKELPMVLHLPKRPGQKESRYTHLLSGKVNIEEFETQNEMIKVPTSKLEERVATLETEMAELKLKLGDLLK